MKKHASKSDLKFILKTTATTEKGEVQNWELIPKSAENMKNELPKIDNVKEKENIIGVNQVSKTKKKKVKKTIIEPEIEPVVTKSRFGRARTLKKFS